METDSGQRAMSRRREGAKERCERRLRAKLVSGSNFVVTRYGSRLTVGEMDVGALSPTPPRKQLQWTSFQ